MSGKQKKETRALPRVFLGVPNYNGYVSVGTFNTVIHALNGHPAKSTHVAGPVFSQSSALCYNYNQLWASFLNMRNKGQADMFAMLHSDLQVVGHPYWDQGRSWLDWMVDTMDRLEVNVLSVSNAIKNRQGHSSVALGNGDWGQRRLSFKELDELPPTLTSAECTAATGQTLLVNTGILVVRPEDRWVDEFCFEFFDKIAAGPDGTRVPLMAPEDWNMSRFLHKFNVPYATTTEVKTLHNGAFDYPNWDDRSGFYLWD